MATGTMRLAESLRNIGFEANSEFSQERILLLTRLPMKADVREQIGFGRRG